MLVVKPNKRRMRYFRDSPAENALTDQHHRPFASRPRWTHVFLTAGIAGAIVLGLIALYPRL
jgi:hypothetical protein